jgi:flagellar biosynthesis/type III secretory pathway protein FliH
LFSSLKATLEATQPSDQDDEDLIMQLSPIYLEQLQEAKQEGKQEGQQQGVVEVILRQLQRRFGSLPRALQEQVSGLSIDQLYALEESMAAFTEVADLVGWLGNE